MDWTEYHHSANYLRELYRRLQEYVQSVALRLMDVDYGDVLGKPEFKVLLNNRWGIKVYPVPSPSLSDPLPSPISHLPFQC